LRAGHFATASNANGAGSGTATRRRIHRAGAGALRTDPPQFAVAWFLRKPQQVEVSSYWFGIPAYTLLWDILFLQK
jgi:hypothetical protein